MVCSVVKDNCNKVLITYTAIYTNANICQKIGDQNVVQTVVDSMYSTFSLLLHTLSMQWPWKIPHPFLGHWLDGNDWIWFCCSANDKN